MSRLSARLLVAGLSDETLAALAAEALSVCPELQNKVDARLAELTPVPQWAVTNVLLSPDLSPRFLRFLDMWHDAASSVCKQWLQAWRDTDDLRRGLRAQAYHHISGKITSMAGTPNGDRIVMAAVPRGTVQHPEISVLDAKSLATLCKLSMAEWIGRPSALVRTEHGTERVLDSARIGCAANDVVYICGQQAEAHLTAGGTITCCKIEDLTVLAEHAASADEPDQFNDGGYSMYSQLALGPTDADGITLLFAIGSYEENHGQPDGILAFDARTLTFCYRFGGSVFSSEWTAQGMAVVGSQVYIGHALDRSLHIFSLAGVHLRKLRGDWRQPKTLLHFEGRIYLHEELGYLEEGRFADHDEDAEADKEEAGKRIFVLTPEGETLQVWKAPQQLLALEQMAICGRRLAYSHTYPVYSAEDDAALLDFALDNFHPERNWTVVISLKGV